MPSRLTTLPSSWPEGTPKMHLVGLSFHWYLLRAVKTRFKLSIRDEASFVLTTTSSTYASARPAEISSDRQVVIAR